MPANKELRGWLALVAVYIFWGSTYLAIRIGVEAFPPFALGSIRYLIAGTILCSATWWRTHGRIEGIHLRSAFTIGFLMLVCGNGGVILAEQTVPSGVASLVVATVPLWLALLVTLRQRRMIQPLVGLGLLVGFLGVGLLASPSPSQHVDPRGVGIMLLGSFLWAVGSLYSRTAPQAQPALLAIGIQMLAGGLLFGILSLAFGEPAHIHFSTQAGLAIAWLVVFGSLVGFSGYILALRLLPTTTASTYAFVNPLIAVLLGWAILGEPVTFQTGIAMATTVIGVTCILTGQRRVAAE